MLGVTFAWGSFQSCLFSVPCWSQVVRRRKHLLWWRKCRRRHVILVNLVLQSCCLACAFWPRRRLFRKTSTQTLKLTTCWYLDLSACQLCEHVPKTFLWQGTGQCFAARKSERGRILGFWQKKRPAVIERSVICLRHCADRLQLQFDRAGQWLQEASGLWGALHMTFKYHEYSPSNCQKLGFYDFYVNLSCSPWNRSPKSPRVSGLILLQFEEW